MTFEALGSETTESDWEPSAPEPNEAFVEAVEVETGEGVDVEPCVASTCDSVCAEPCVADVCGDCGGSKRRATCESSI